MVSASERRSSSPIYMLKRMRAVAWMPAGTAQKMLSSEFAAVNAERPTAPTWAMTRPLTMRPRRVM